MLAGTGKSGMRLKVMVACALALFTGVAFAQKKIQPSRLNFFSKQQDVQLGREAAAQIERQVAIVEDKTVNDYVVRIGKRLAAQPEADDYPYVFKVVYDKSVNAFALPGGPAFVHTGLILAADNEAQIAGVLAHEVAHVALRHGTSQVTKANFAQLALGVGGAILGSGSLLGQLAQIGAGLGANSLLLKFSRSAESDADLLGARIMAKAGYDPVEMARFFEKLEQQEKRTGRSIPQFLSDHPSPGNRVKAVSEEVKLLPKREYAKGDPAELERIKRTIAALPVPPKANTDFRRAADPSAARPSARLQQYRSRGLALAYPENWQVFSNRQTSEVTIASPEGILQGNGNAEIGYGAVVGVARSAQPVELRQETEAFLERLIRTNRNMQRTQESSRPIEVAGRAGLLNLLYSSSPYAGQKEVDAVVTATHPEGLFYLILIAPESEYAKAQPIFDQMIRSVQFTR